MFATEYRGRFDRVRAAMERVRAGFSDVEEIDLPSGGKVTIQRDQSAPAGVRIETTNDSGEIGQVVLPGLRDRRGAPEPEADAKSFRSQTFCPMDSPPPDYPEDFPFLPNCAASVSIMDPGGERATARNAAWLRPADPLRAMAEIKAQLRETGWVEGETSQASTYMGRTLSSTFIRGKVQRSVALMAFGEVCQIMLFEKQEE